MHNSGQTVGLETSIYIIESLVLRVIVRHFAGETPDGGARWNARGRRQRICVFCLEDSVK